jgi:hypothetical protein
MQLVITPSGDVRCIYGEAIDLAQLGPVTIRRGSHVEPASQGLWLADLGPVNGPVLGPFACRSQALAAEEVWLAANWLAAAATDAPRSK